MPSRSILSAAEHDSLLALPDTKDDPIRHYALSDADLSIIGGCVAISTSGQITGFNKIRAILGHPCG